MAEVICGMCDRRTRDSYCQICLDATATEAGEEAVQEYTGQHMDGAPVRAWAERRRLLHGMSAEAVAEFERCATDLDEGFRE